MSRLQFRQRFQPISDFYLKLFLFQGCVNPQDPSDATTVCCRDPNYKDPWPNMNGNGGGKNMNNRNNNNGGGKNSNYSQNGNGIQPRNGNQG